MKTKQVAWLTGGGGFRGKGEMVGVGSVLRLFSLLLIKGFVYLSRITPQEQKQMSIFTSRRGLREMRAAVVCWL